MLNNTEIENSLLADFTKNFVKDFGYDTFKDFEDTLNKKELSVSLFNDPYRKSISILNVESDSLIKFANKLGYKKYFSLEEVLKNLPSVEFYDYSYGLGNAKLNIYLK